MPRRLLRPSRRSPRPQQRQPVFPCMRCCWPRLACGLRDAQPKLDALVAVQPVALDAEAALGGVTAAAVAAGRAAGLGWAGDCRLRRAARRGLAAAHCTRGDGAGSRRILTIVCSRAQKWAADWSEDIIREAVQSCGAR